jgi:hypothetical protein
MIHSCSNGAYGGIELLFQLKENEEIETMFQWFKVQCKMWGLHVIVHFRWWLNVV